MEKRMRIYIQTSQVLGCACVIAKKKNISKLNVYRLLETFRNINAVIDKECNATLENVTKKNIKLFVGMNKNIFDYDKENSILIKEGISEKIIASCFTQSIPISTKQVIDRCLENSLTDVAC